MHGFVDVSRMSDLEVKRLGQADEDFVPRNPYAYRKPVARVPKNTINFNTDDVFAAACAAFRINGSYIKAAVGDAVGLKTNRQIADELLKDTAQITQEDRERGEAVRRYFKALTFKLIEGKAMSDFNNTAMKIADKEAITSTYDLAVIVSLPATYEKSSKRDDVERRIKWAQGGYVGVIGEKVELKIELVKELWSQNWNVWYLTGITAEDQVVFFSSKKQYALGSKISIQGKVKSHRETSTQLSHVKVVK